MPKIEKIKLPVLITRGAVCFPGNDLVVYCERSFSINAVIDSTKDYNSLVFLTTQKDIDKIFNTLDSELKEAKKRFNKKQSDKSSRFKLE